MSGEIVEGPLKSLWIFGNIIFNYFMVICGVYVTLVGFLSALFFQDWIVRYDKAYTECYDYISAYY